VIRILKGTHNFGFYRAGRSPTPAPQRSCGKAAGRVVRTPDQPNHDVQPMEKHNMAIENPTPPSPGNRPGEPLPGAPSGHNDGAVRIPAGSITKFDLTAHLTKPRNRARRAAIAPDLTEALIVLRKSLLAVPINKRRAEVVPLIAEFALAPDSPSAFLDLRDLLRPAGEGQQRSASAAVRADPLPNTLPAQPIGRHLPSGWRVLTGGADEVPA
jgi:hypothetical protein